MQTSYSNFTTANQEALASLLETPSLSDPAYVPKATPATHPVLTFISKSTCQTPMTVNQPTTMPPIQHQSFKSKVFYEPENSYQFPSRRPHCSSSWTDLPDRVCLQGPRRHDAGRL